MFVCYKRYTECKCLMLLRVGFGFFLPFVYFLTLFEVIWSKKKKKKGLMVSGS